MYLSVGHSCDFTGAAGLLAVMPAAKVLLADWGYDADWHRTELIENGITLGIRSKKNRKVQIKHDAILSKKCHKI